MKIYFINKETCTRVKLFGEDVLNLFLINGNIVSDSVDKADYIFINTCSFLQVKEDYFLDLISNLYSKKKAKQKLAVIGCLGATNKDAIYKISNDILIFKRDVNEIAQYFHFDKFPETKATGVTEKRTLSDKCINFINDTFLHSKHIDYRLKKENVCYIQISTGCLGKCSYCSERFITRLKSRPISEILEAVYDGMERGYNLFGLSADDTSAYGRDISTNIGELLTELSKIDEDIYFTIPEFNPQGLTDEVIKLLKDPKFLYITIPIQSGSQHVLNLMKRPYNISKVEEQIRKLHSANPNLMVNTHLIVGFPAERPSDFNRTLKLVETGLFDRVKVFKYSERPGTEAAQLYGKVAEEEKERRRKKLLSTVRKVNLKKLSLTNLLLNLDQIH